MTGTGRGVRVAAALCAALVVVAGSSPAAAYPRPGRTERVSMAFDGAEANGSSALSSQDGGLSADGRYVAFHSNASNLVPGDTNGLQDPFAGYDVFVHDRETRSIERVSVASDGTEANGYSFSPSMSADGRYVAFWSRASNLVAGDSNGREDVFVHDRETGTTERVSVASDGSEGNDGSFTPSISADGRYVAFRSRASNLVADDTNGRQEVFVHDRETGTTERVSVASDGSEGNGESFAPSISADGRYVAFRSAASNLVPDDTNGYWDVFVRDREAGTTERVSVAGDGAQANGGSDQASISADGRYVAFRSWAANLVPEDTYGSYDVFVRDRQAGTTERVSVGSDGRQANGNSMYPTISADGRHVAFASFASLTPGDTPPGQNPFAGADVFVHDRETGAAEQVSVASDGTPGNDESLVRPSLNADGRFVAFHSAASNLVPGDMNGHDDVFVRDRGPRVGAGGPAALPAGDEVSVSGWATFSGQVTAVADPPDDGLPAAGPVGAELTGASLTYRPENEDLFVRLQLASLPGVAAGTVPVVARGSGAGAPAVLYGLELDVEGVRYEVRAQRSATTAAAPYFALYRCDAGEPYCTWLTGLSGGIGTTGPGVAVSVPLSDLGLQEGAAVTGLRAFTTLGEIDTGGPVRLDEAELPDVDILKTSVALGIAPPGTPGEQVAFDVEAALDEGAFSGTVDTSALPAGDYEVWARACLGQRCGTASTPLTVPPATAR